MEFIKKEVCTLVKLEDQVLPEDIKESQLLHNYAIDCSARVTAYTYHLEFEEAEKWLREYQRAVNEIKYFKFKKKESGRRKDYAKI
ncbi:hypothetical protein H1D32_13180 [Anaerobacillus sp. CMMVII]|uniref:hypothetical protein n=1 Tax=Anaerobacillus sp. CMMVII TaxID=2755588 RepID=UPI0021B754A8|nr:hypothetical protein [Anaerobacillus sp. CMMVII]MCT8138609.1 hypothetical protein [Anaerobacillus sp. CMMVII]